MREDDEGQHRPVNLVDATGSLPHVRAKRGRFADLGDRREQDHSSAKHKERFHTER